MYHSIKGGATVDTLQDILYHTEKFCHKGDNMLNDTVSSNETQGRVYES